MGAAAGSPSAVWGEVQPTKGSVADINGTDWQTQISAGTWTPGSGGPTGKPASAPPGYQYGLASSSDAGAQGFGSQAGEWILMGPSVAAPAAAAPAAQTAAQQALAPVAANNGTPQPQPANGITPALVKPAPAWSDNLIGMLDPNLLGDT